VKRPLDPKDRIPVDDRIVTETLFSQIQGSQVLRLVTTPTSIARQREGKERNPINGQSLHEESLPCNYIKYILEDGE